MSLYRGVRYGWVEIGKLARVEDRADEDATKVGGA